jgi:glycosyltransferase involved in cell wall biosynthesis
VIKSLGYGFIVVQSITEYKNMPEISVIIPVYNGEKTIQETIESVLHQTYTSFEILVINGGSADSTLDIVSHISDRRIKLFNYPQANVAVNRNRGLTNASGEFITFLDADDIWTKDKLELQYKALQESPEATVAYSWTNAIDQTGKFLRVCSHAQWEGNVYAKFLLDDFIGNGSNVMVRSFAFQEVGNFNETLTNAEDTEMWIRLAARYNFVPVEKVQVFYRISPNSKSSHLSGLEISNLKVIELAFTNADPSLQYLKPHRIANLYKYLIYKALTVSPSNQNNSQVMRFLWQSILNDPSMIQKPIIYKAILKFLVMNLLPEKIAVSLLQRFPRLFDMSTFFGYMKTNLV